MNRHLQALARFQARRPFVVVAVVLALSLISLRTAVRLKVNSDLTALLPESMPSVRDLAQITKRFGAPQTFTLLVTSSDPQANRRFVRDVVPRLQALDRRVVLSVDWNIREYYDFLNRNLMLFADEKELVELRDALAERIRTAKAHANPLFVELDDEPPQSSLEKLIESLRKRHQVDSRAEQRLADGYFEHPDGRSIAVFLRTTIRGGEATEMESLITSVRSIVAAANPRRYTADLRVEYGGGVLDMRAEQRALEDAALTATIITLVLVSLVILIFFLRWRSIPILLIGIVPPMCLTFAFAQLSVAYLTASSAFLSAIVIGNGINPHIIWLARYFEARRAGRTPELALEEAHIATLPGTLSASLAAAVAYASLALTAFRAFRDFGLIGCVGMVLCWIATFTWTPVIALLWERIQPTRTRNRGTGNLYGRLTERLALSRPPLVFALGMLLTAASAAGVIRWALHDPIEYDFRNLQSQRYNSPLQVINRRIAAIVDETTNGSAIAILVRSRIDAPYVVKQLEDLRKRSPDTLGAIRSIDDLLPHEQAKKLPLVREIRKLMLEVRPELDGKELADLEKYLPPEQLHVVTEQDLPETVARPFIELDGRRGSIVYVEHNLEQNQFDGRYLVRWAAAARAPTNLDASHVAVAGAAPVVADLVEAVVRDGPKAVIASYLATVTLLFFAFYRRRERVFTLGAHFIGVVWMMGAMALLGVKINFLNFVALPVAFGLGVDYSVNVMRRFVEEKHAGKGEEQAVRAAVRETGGAVILCSFTTLIGYISLYASPNRGVNSFGIAMSIAEITCLVAAVLVLPAALVLKRRSEVARNG